MSDNIKPLVYEFLYKHGVKEVVDFVNHDELIEYINDTIDYIESIKCIRYLTDDVVQYRAKFKINGSFNGYVVSVNKGDRITIKSISQNKSEVYCTIIKQGKFYDDCVIDLELFNFVFEQIDG